MKLIKSSYEILEQKPGLEGIYDMIETAGRNCYRSDRKKEVTSKDFTDRMIRSGHLSMLEHGTVYLVIPTDNLPVAIEADPYSRVTYNPNVQDLAYVTTNFRTLLECFDKDVMKLLIRKYLSRPSEFHEKRVTVRFTTSNGIMRELTRHRKFSFAVESTRYCNYTQDKFNNEITTIMPYWVNLPEGSYTVRRDSWCVNGIFPAMTPAEKNLINYLDTCDSLYDDFVHDYKMQPQQAREILPLCTKCDVIMTGFVSDWKYFFNLRSSKATTGKPHPDMMALADPLYEEFIERRLITQ